MKFGLCIWCGALRWITCQRNCCWPASWLIQPSLVLSSVTLAGGWPSLVLRNMPRCLWPVKDDLTMSILGVCCIVWKCTMMYVGQTGNSIQTRIRVLHWHVLPYHSFKSPIAEEEWAWVIGSCYRTPLSWLESVYGLGHHGSNILITVTITITGKVLCPWVGYEHLSFTPWRNKRELFRGIKWWFGSFWQWFLKIAVTYPVPVTGCFFSTFCFASFSLLFFLYWNNCIYQSVLFCWSPCPIPSIPILTGLLFCMTCFFFLHFLYSKALPQFVSLLTWRWRQYFPLEWWNMPTR